MKKISELEREKEIILEKMKTLQGLISTGDIALQIISLTAQVKEINLKIKTIESVLTYINNRQWFQHSTAIGNLISDIRGEPRRTHYVSGN